jgi:acetoacetate decarboxylase
VKPADVFATALAMPLPSPSFARGPYRYGSRKYLIVSHRTGRAPLAEAVPEPLTFDEPLVRCEFMRMESSTGFGRYSGAAQ